MRLLIVSNTYPPADISGVASLAYEMAHQLASAGHDVQVLNRQVDDPSNYGVAVGGSKVQYPFRAGLRFWRLAGEKPFDLIHVHESDGFFVVVLFWLARKLGLARGRGKLVATLQVSYDEERRKVKTVSADGEPVSEPTAEEKTFARFKARIHAFFGRVTCRLADRVVAPSRVTAGELVQDYGARDVAVIYNGIAVDDLISRAADEHAERLASSSPSSSGSSKATETVIYAGRMRTRKAVAVLLHAFRKVLAERPSARLILVGDGEQYPALQELHERLELGERVEFLGRRNREDLFPLFAQADVYCLPSLYEGFPLATLEAMAVGLPVVSTTVSGIPEAVDHGTHGLLVPPEASAELSDALIELLADAEKRRKMGRLGRERVLQEFTIDRIAADYLDLWQNLVSGSGDSASLPTSN